MQESASAGAAVDYGAEFVEFVGSAFRDWRYGSPDLDGDTWTICATVGQDNAVIPSYPDAGDLGLTGIFTIKAEIFTPVKCFPYDETSQW